MIDILSKTHEWATEAGSVVLAVVAETWGSAPRPAGSLMVIGKDGTFEGSVSGGCVESTVIAEAQAMDKARHKSLSFTVSTNDAWQVGLACGGKIRIELFNLTKDETSSLDRVRDSHFKRRSGALYFSKTENTTRFIPDGHPTNCQHEIFEQGCELILAVRPAPQLFITGAVHIAQALAPMAISCGYEVTIIDPRGIFTDNRDFGGACIVTDWPDEVLSKHVLDNETVIVALTHDPKIDDVALQIALESDSFYIGALGSKKTHAARLKRLEGTPGLERIQGPIGLNIGAKSPAEIAVSIIAEITMKKRKSDAL